MKREVVQDFLNLPGIVGVALMDGRSRPYFCGVDQALNFQQREVLAQGIQQVVETTPTGFQFFEFQFTEHQVYIYKLEHAIILLVLTGKNLVYSDYAEAVECLKAELQEDISNAIATFRLLAGNITLSNQNYWKGRSDGHASTLTHPTDSAHSTDSAATGCPSNAPQTSNQANHSRSPLPVSSSSTDQSSLASSSVRADSPTPDGYVNADVGFKEVLAALNHLSQFTTQYLGTTVVTNYWKTTRPTEAWLSQFQVDRAAKVNFTPSGNGVYPQTLTLEQRQWLQEWVAAFIQRCSKVIRDFPITVERVLDERQRYLLFNQNH